jgi:hypothetical protein
VGSMLRFYKYFRGKMAMLTQIEPCHTYAVKIMTLFFYRQFVKIAENHWHFMCILRAFHRVLGKTPPR